MKKEQLEKFEQLGTTDIEEQAGEFQVECMSVFITYPKLWFTQMHFVTGMGKSNPFVNKTLRSLEEKHLIKRERRGSKYHYQLVPRTTKA